MTAERAPAARAMTSVDDLGLTVPFVALSMERDHVRRGDEASLAAAAADPSARCCFFDEDLKVHVDGTGAVVWSSVPSGAAPADLLFLGTEAEAPLFALVLDPESPTVDNFSRAVPAREVIGVAEPVDAAAVLQATGVFAWHRRHPFCASCGSSSAVAGGGHTRRCTECGTTHFPRIDPAVIMLVSDGEACVLGRRRGSAEGRWSTLAGYVEPGESLEMAVAREVAEEVGLAVSDIVYRGSQPWPFPASLMVAFTAYAERADLVCDEEHAAVRWFERDELRAGFADGSIAIPPTISAGGYLIRSWVGDPSV